MAFTCLVLMYPLITAPQKIWHSSSGHKLNSNPFCIPGYEFKDNLGCLKEIQRIWVLLTGFLCVALGVLELALKTRMAKQSTC